MSETTTSECPFCEIDYDQFLMETPSAIVLLDKYPVSKGHALVIPKMHVSSIFDLSFAQQADVWNSVCDAKEALKDNFRLVSGVDGFNIGINDGKAAGQTIDHAHIHVIPRFEGDVKDPRGGVRWVLSEKADYWSNNEQS